MQNNPYQAPSAAPAGAPGGGLSTGTYEFNEIENLTIRKMGSRAWWWGLFSVIIGVCGVIVIAILFAVRGDLAETGIEPQYITLGIVALLPVAVSHLVMAFNYMGAGSALKQVVNTEGNDIELLMASLRKLGTAFMVEFAIGAVSMVVGFSAGVMMSDFDTGSESASFDFDD